MKKNGWKPEKFRSVEVTARIWQRLEMSMPFDPMGELSLSEQESIHDHIAECLLEHIDDEYLPEISELDVWLTDDAGQPLVFLTGLLAVLDGHLSQRKLRRATEEARMSIPPELLESGQAV